MKNLFEKNSPDFINFKEFIEKEFNKNYFIIDTPKINVLFHQLGSKKKKQGVIINKSEMISQNLYLLNSYFPEFLACICFICINKKSFLSDVLHNLSRKKCVDNSINFSKKLLDINFFRFFETIFFSNLFNQVWKGEYLNRIFAFKQKNKLHYFGMLQIFYISKVIYDNVLIKSIIISQERDRFIFKLLFHVDAKVVIRKMYKRIIEIESN